MLRRVVHVTFDMRIGGAEQVIRNLVENTDRLRFDVSVLCLSGPIGPFGRNLQEKGFCVTALDRKPGLDFRLIKRVHAFVSEEKVDVLHCHQYSPYVYGILGSLGTKAKVVFTEHGRFYPDQRKLKRVLINPLLTRATEHVTAISRATREALVRFENFQHDGIKVVYNGIDDSRFMGVVDKGASKRFIGLSEGANVLGAVSRLDPIKNHSVMIRGLKMVCESFPETFLIIVGDGPERMTLESFVRHLDLTDHVIFTGFREDTEVFYKAMDVFLLPSFSEGTAMTLLEAMASGLPCVVTDVGGNPEIVVDGATGFVIPIDDDGALSENVCRLLADKELMDRMGKAGRKRFEENFTLRKMVEAYQALYV